MSKTIGEQKAMPGKKAAGSKPVAAPRAAMVTHSTQPGSAAATGSATSTPPVQPSDTHGKKS